MNKKLRVSLLGIVVSGIVYIGVYGWSGITASTGDALSAAKWNEMITTIMMPSGAVVAFNLASCPTGWTEYTSARGRTLIGTNPNTANGLSMRSLNATLGEENHTLTIPEMPAHNHTPSNNSINQSMQLAGGGGGFYASSYGGVIVQNAPPTGTTGSGQSHNVMQPSLALLYCSKD